MSTIREETYQSYLQAYYFTNIYYVRFFVDVHTLVALWQEGDGCELFDYDNLLNYPICQN